MTQSVLASLQGVRLGGAVGVAIGWWIERWMGSYQVLSKRRRPIAQHACPHGFATVRDCPTCAHFANIRAAEQQENQ